MNENVRRLKCWVREVCFFHAVGPRAGEGWGGALGGAAWGGLFQLNSVHCNRTRGGRSRSPAFLQSAVCLHDCRCAGGRWQFCITTPSDNTYCLYLCSLSTGETRTLYSLLQMLKTAQAFSLYLTSSFLLYINPNGDKGFTGGWILSVPSPPFVYEVK